MFTSGNDEGNLRVGPPGARVVDHDRPRGGRDRSELTRHRSARAEESHLDPSERLRRQLFDHHLAAREGELLPRASRARESDEPLYGEAPLLQDLQHFATDRTGRANHGDDKRHGPHMAYISS